MPFLLTNFKSQFPINSDSAAFITAARLCKIVSAFPLELRIKFFQMPALDKSYGQLPDHTFLIFLPYLLLHHRKEYTPIVRNFHIIDIKFENFMVKVGIGSFSHKGFCGLELYSLVIDLLICILISSICIIKMFSI